MTADACCYLHSSPDTVLDSQGFTVGNHKSEVASGKVKMPSTGPYSSYPDKTMVSQVTQSEFLRVSHLWCNTSSNLTPYFCEGYRSTGDDFMPLQSQSLPICVPVAPLFIRRVRTR